VPQSSTASVQPPSAGASLWGVELSPFALKLAAMLDWAAIPYRWLPREGSRLENLAASFKIARAKRKGRVLRYGGRSELDEYPTVPFLITSDRDVHCDSSALAGWIDAKYPPKHGDLLPHNPVLNFLVRLVDEAFDEFGLYMVHHNRWVLAAADNGAGQRLAAMESLLEVQPYLFGGRFTLADASAYGELSMNLTDASAAAVLEERAPRTYGWLCSIRDGEHCAARGELELTDALQPLLDVIGETFIPLMRQNEEAYEAALERGETTFNEAAFSRGLALYDGELRGQAFRHVVKTFQVRTWRDLRGCWTGLGSEERLVLGRRLPGLEEAFVPPRSRS
jgi:hypothetical protein